MTSQDSKPKPEFYRRVLPEGCIAFSSTEGKTIFKEAILSGHMDCYFKMAAQFSTQAEPAFCGLTTLIMVLNALEVDPGKVWKGPWRWYHEDMLECCVPLQEMKEKGITYDQFLCLAACNSLEVESTRMENSASLETFRDHVTRLSRQDDHFIALSYSRKTLGQTGDGHFSPVGGYHPDRDLVLVMDTARFKYPPHWVPLANIWEAMKPVDQSTGKSRGYCILSKTHKDGSLRLFKLSNSFNIFLPCACTSSVSSFLYKWRECLSKDVTDLSPVDTDKESDTDNGIPSEHIDIFRQAIPLLLTSAGCIAQDECILTTYIDMATFSAEHIALKETLVQQIECTEIYGITKNVFQNTIVESSAYLNIGTTTEKNVITLNDKCCGMRSTKRLKISETKMFPAHFITVFLLCWPFELFGSTGRVTFGDKMDSYVTRWMGSTTCKELKEEVSQLKKQLLVLLKLRMSSQQRCGPNTSCRISPFGTASSRSGNS